MHSFFKILDEKEKYDPSSFRDAIIQGLTETGNDLDLVSNQGLKCRFVPRSKALLAYDQYCHVPFLAGTLLCHFPFKILCVDKRGNSKCTGENKYCIMYQNKE